MAGTTLSTKGQVVIPREIRERHGWAPGMELEVEERGNCIVLRPVTSARRTTVDDLVGCLPYDGPPKSLEEMELGIARGAGDKR